MGTFIFMVIYFILQLTIPIAVVIFVIKVVKKSKENMTLRTNITNPTIVSNNAKLVCPKCGYEMASGNNRCPKCGESLVGVTPIAIKKYVCEDCKSETNEEIKFCASCGSNKISIVEEQAQPTMPSAQEGTPINKKAYANYLYSTNEDTLIKTCIDEELKKTTVEKNQSLIGIEIRRTIMTAIYCIILFLIALLYVSYHTNLVLILLLLVVLTIIFLKIISKSGLKKTLIKEVKSRPDEKVSYIIASTLSSQSCNKFIGLGIRLLLIIITISIPFIIFKEPHLVYEEVSNGYNLRYYTLGLLKSEKVVEIPSQYKGKDVIGLRGDVFENVYSLEKIVLPETIEEIRSGAFKNCFNLKEINLPSKITEIHGETFRNCSSLQKIIIPEGVTRIGGSAFRYCSSLTEVTIPKTVTEIGSSAFRETALSTVCIPRSAYVNERAFKGTYANITYYENNCESAGEINYNE